MKNSVYCRRMRNMWGKKAKETFVVNQKTLSRMEIKRCVFLLYDATKLMKVRKINVFVIFICNPLKKQKKVLVSFEMKFAFQKWSI